MPTLYIIDGYGQFFRNYHAIRTPMTSPVTKEPTNMTFGFVGMLFKLLRGQGNLAGRPDYIVVALDVSGDRGTFRSQLYPDYKAHRPPPPEDLFPQVDRCVAMLKEIGVPVIGAEGFEADDVVAALVRKLRKAHPDLVIRMVAKDKDLKQLLEPGHVELFDVHNDSAFTAETLESETGLKPHQVIDMLALMGDTVDNVPGVDRVGEKTAAALIKEYGSIDKLLANADQIKGKRGENIRAAAPELPLSRTLVTLRDDVELPPEALDLSRASVSRLKLDRMAPILKELGFNRYQDDLRALTGDVPVMPLVPSPEKNGPARASQRSKPVDLNQPSLFSSGLFDQATDSPASTKPIAEGAYECIRTKAQLTALVKSLAAAPAVAVDTETTTLSPIDARLCGLSFATTPGTAWYVPVRSPTPNDHLDEKTVLDALRPVLEDAAKPKLGHNIKYDYLVLRGAGVDLKGLWTPGSCDSMVASYLIDSARSSHSLDALSLALLGKGKQSINELIGSGKQQRSFEAVPVDTATPYAAGDADLSLQLALTMLPQLRAMQITDLFEKLELPLVEVLAELEWNGIIVDPDELDHQAERLNARIKQLSDELQDEAMRAIGRTFDPDSPKQLAAALFNKTTDAEPGLGIKPVRKTKTGYSTDAEVLEKLAGDLTLTTPIPNLILEYRQLTKLVSTYLVALKQAINPRTRRIHTSFNQTVAATGRLASSDPNLQNIPIRSEIGREIRKAFIAPPGHVLITADYSQIELRLLAHLSKDPGLTEAFLRGEDIHTQVAAQIHDLPLDKVTKDQRAGAKMVNFGIVYGITAYGLARRLGIGDKQAAAIIDAYKRRFAGITTFLEECVAQAKRYGYVETMLKRRRPITDIDSRNPSIRSLAERVAINSVVQGSAADLIKLAMVDLHALIKGYPRPNEPEAGADAKKLRGVRMLLQIHDELVFECPKERAEEAMETIVRRMESAMSLSVPLKADARIGANWFEGK